MIGRRWTLGLSAVIIVVLLADTAIWLFATSALHATAEMWAEQRRAAGTAVALNNVHRGGWPLAAVLHMDARLGPGGIPAGAVLTAILTSRLALNHPSLIQTDITEARLIPAGAPPLVATASEWTVTVPWTDPTIASMRASDWHLTGAGVAIGARVLEGSAMATPPSTLRVVLRAGDVDVGSHHPAASALGAVRSADLDVVLPVGLPVAAATPTASARAWRDAGGRVDVRTLALAWGPLDASATGTLGLDAALRPAGSFTVAARGLPAFLEALGQSGAIPAHTGQAAGGVLALLGGTGGSIDIPVSLADGRVAVAGFPLARLPPAPWEPQ